MKRIPSLSVLLFGIAIAAPAVAAAAGAKSEFITLGTMGGPIPSAHRSQPASLLRSNGEDVLIDAGDGVSEQLAKIGIPLGEVRTIFLSHLHFDHTGGLFGFLGMRYQVRNRLPVTIYGTVGTARLIAGLLAAMQPGADIGVGYPDAARKVAASPLLG